MHGCPDGQKSVWARHTPLYLERFLEAPADILNHFWIQTVVLFMYRFQKRNGYRFMAVMCNDHFPTDTNTSAHSGVTCYGHVKAVVS